LPIAPETTFRADGTVAYLNAASVNIAEVGGISDTQQLDGLFSPRSFGISNIRLLRAVNGHVSSAFSAPALVDFTKAHAAP